MKNFLSKKATFFVLLSLLGFSVLSQNFVWKNGNSVVDLPGIYGTQGTAAAANTPGARESSISWKDKSGNFWLFGGLGKDNTGADDYLNDLWRYDPTANEWTWVNGSNAVDQVGVYGNQGVYSSSSVPGARQSSVSWRDTLGNLWLFGGYGYDGSGTVGELNDLWEYNVSTNQWRWFQGGNTCFQNATYGTQGVPTSANIPGARYRALAWTDASGNFWMFGGYGYTTSGAYGRLNDLWKFNTVTSEWTWVKGSNQTDQFSTYGTQNVPAAANVPGARMSPSGWIDATGNLWLIGGDGYSSSGPADIQSDLWRYTVSSNQWAWIKGYNNTTLQQGIYGTQNTPASANMPGARYGAITWLDGTGDLWLFSGYGYDTGNLPDDLNDLWRYNIVSNQWVWVKGSSITDQPGVFGAQNFPSPLNIPGSRNIALSWKDNSNNLWLFGGSGHDGASGIGKLNDLWKFVNCIGPTVTIVSSNDTVCAGESAVLTAGGANTYSWVSGQTTTTISVAPLGTSSYTIYGTDLYQCTDTATYTLTILDLPTLSVTSTYSLICKGESATLVGSGAIGYSWSNNANGSNAVVTPTSTTTYTVIGTDINNCSNFATFTQSVALCLGIENIVGGPNGVLLYPNPSLGEFTVKRQQDASALVILNTLGQNVFEQTLESDETTLRPPLSKGIYTYRLMRGDQVIMTGKLMIN